MDAEVAHSAFQQGGADRVRHPANPDLQTRAVLDLRCDKPPDRAVDFCEWGIRQFRGRRIVAVDHEIHFADMDPVIDAMAIGQLLVHFDDNDLGALNYRPVPQAGCAEVEVAVGALWANLEDGDIDAVDKAAVVIRYFAKIDGNVMANSGIMLFPVIARKMPTKPEIMLTTGISFEHSARLHRNA